MLFDRDYDPLTKPGLEAELDPDFYSGQGMPALRLLLNEGGGNPRDLVGQNIFSLNSGVGWSPGIDGPCLNFTAASSGQATGPVISGLTNQLTLYARVTPNSVSSFRTLIDNEAGTGTRGFFLRISSGVIDAFIHNGSVQELTGTIAISAGHTYDLAATYDGAFLRVYVNGQLDASKAVTGNITASAFSALLGTFGSGFYFDGLFHSAMVAKFAATPGQIALLAANPYADVLQPRAMRVFSPSSSAKTPWHLFQSRAA